MFKALQLFGISTKRINKDKLLNRRTIISASFEDLFLIDLRSFLKAAVKKPLKVIYFKFCFKLFKGANITFF